LTALVASKPIVNDKRKGTPRTVCAGKIDEPGPVVIDGEEEWEVSGIMMHRFHSAGTFYLVTWKGWALGTWEPEWNLENSQEAIAEYWRSRDC
jgi:Chromo (CHRromatin Organisation MOdifier) domain